jgi:hypothetical protein
MPISNEKLLQRIVKKYDLIPYNKDTLNVYKPKPTGLIEFNGGIIKLDYRGFWLCELIPTYEPEYNTVSAYEYVFTSRKDLHKNIKKILKVYKKCNLIAKQLQLKSKLKQIDKDF